MENFVNINNKKIYYKWFCKEYFSENKPIIIFLHEGLGCTEQWKDFPELLCAKLQLTGLSYDRYGHGKSTVLKEERNLDFLHTEARVFLYELVEKLNISNKLVLFGHSDGGTLALLFASFYIEKVDAVITEAHHIVVEKLSRKGIEDAIELYKSGWLKEKLEKYHGNNTESMFYAWANTWTKPETEKWNIENEISKIKCPILSIQGMEDEYGSKIQLEILQKLNLNFEGNLLKKCGHIPHLQQKEEVLEMCKYFIEKKFVFISQKS